MLPTTSKSAPFASTLVRSLEADGLLSRTRHPAHGRILLAGLTGAGRRALKRGRAVGMLVQDRVLSGLSDSDRKRLLRLLEAIEHAA